LLQLTVDGVIERRVYRIALNNGLLMPTPFEVADPDSSFANSGTAQISASNDNAASNYEGWAPEQESAYRAIGFAQFIDTTGASVDVKSAAPPSVDQTLIATSATTATWQTPDHGSIAGLSDDDHTQYLLVDGTRAMTGALDMGTFAITNVGNVDGVDVSAHASRHIQGGADEIDGDQVDVDVVFTNVVADTSPPEVTDSNHLGAILKGIDNSLTGMGSGVSATITTDSGTPTKTIFTHTTTTDDRIIVMDLTFMASDHTVDETNVFSVLAVFYRNSSSVVSERDVYFVNGPFEEDLTWDVSFMITGPSIDARVTGDATNDTEWKVTGRIDEHG